MKNKITKLVRDRIPQIIKEQGENPSVTTLDNDQMFREALLKKLHEEFNELQMALLEKNKEHIIEEFADINEVIKTLQKLERIQEDDVITQQKKKFAIRGGFSQRLSIIL